LLCLDDASPLCHPGEIVWHLCSATPETVLPRNSFSGCPSTQRIKGAGELLRQRESRGFRIRVGARMHGIFSDLLRNITDAIQNYCRPCLEGLFVLRELVVQLFEVKGPTKQSVLRSLCKSQKVQHSRSSPFPYPTPINHPTHFYFRQPLMQHSQHIQT
jgi:hypothetical protein